MLGHKAGREDWLLTLSIPFLLCPLYDRFGDPPTETAPYLLDLSCCDTSIYQEVDKELYVRRLNLYRKQKGPNYLIKSHFISKFAQIKRKCDEIGWFRLELSEWVIRRGLLFFSLHQTSAGYLKKRFNPLCRWSDGKSLDPISFVNAITSTREIRSQTIRCHHLDPVDQNNRGCGCSSWSKLVFTISSVDITFTNADSSCKAEN